MIKGLRKNIVFLRCDADSPFESALFILKDSHLSESDTNIIAKATELIASGEEKKVGFFEKRRRKKRKNPIF